MDAVRVTRSLQSESCPPSFSWNVRYLRKLVVKRLAFSVALCLLAGLSFGASDFAETKALADQGNAEAQNNLGMMYGLGKGVPQDDAEAVKWLRKAALKDEAEIERLKQRLEEKPADLETLMKLGSAYANLNQYGKAIKTVRAAVELKPDDPNLRVQLGNLLDDSADPDGAIIQYLAAIRLDPKDAFAHRNIGLTYIRKGDFKAAEAALREAVRLKPDYFFARENLALVLVNRKDVEGAFKQWREMIRLDRKRVATIANLLPAAGDNRPLWQELKEEWREFERASEDAAAHLMVAWGSGDGDTAIKQLKKAINVDSNFALAHQILSSYYVQKSKLKNARSAAQKAIQLNPNLPNAHIGMGNYYRAKDKPEDAIKSFQAALRIAPSLAKAHFNLANVYSNAEQVDEAITAYEKALVVDPKFDARNRVHNNLAIAYFKKSQYETSWQHAQEARRLGGNVHPGFLVALTTARNFQLGLAADSNIFSKVTGKWVLSNARSLCVEDFYTIRFLKNNSVAEFTKSKPSPGDVEIVPDTYTVLGHSEDRILMFLDSETQKTSDGELVEWELILYSPHVYYWRRTDWDAKGSPILRCATDAKE